MFVTFPSLFISYNSPIGLASMKVTRENMLVAVRDTLLHFTASDWDKLQRTLFFKDINIWGIFGAYLAIWGIFGAYLGHIFTSCTQSVDSRPFLSRTMLLYKYRRHCFLIFIK